MLRLLNDGCFPVFRRFFVRQALLLTRSRFISTSVCALVPQTSASVQLSEFDKAARCSLPKPIVARDAASEGIHYADNRFVVLDVPFQGTFFVSSAVYQHCVEWAALRPGSTGGRVLVIAGPPRSGRTAALTQVLPGLLSAQYHSHATAVPILLHISCVEAGASAARLPLAIVQATAHLAQSLGARAQLPPPAEDCLGLYRNKLDALARLIASRGGELCITFDDVEVGGGLAKAAEFFGASKKSSPNLSLAGGCPRSTRWARAKALS